MEILLLHLLYYKLDCTQHITQTFLLNGHWSEYCILLLMTTLPIVQSIYVSFMNGSMKKMELIRRANQSHL